METGEQHCVWEAQGGPGLRETCYMSHCFLLPMSLARNGCQGHSLSTGGGGGVGCSFTSRSHPSYCLPGQMLLSRGSWGLYLPSNLEDSVLTSPKDGPCPCMFP